MPLLMDKATCKHLTAVCIELSLEFSELKLRTKSEIY